MRIPRFSLTARAPRSVAALILAIWAGLALADPPPLLPPVVAPPAAPSPAPANPAASSVPDVPKALPPRVGPRRPAPAASPVPAPAAPAAPAPAALPRIPPGSASREGDTLLPPPEIDWKEIAQLPPPAGFNDQPGLAGSFAGSQDNHLIIAGGANYAAGQAWNEAPRAYWSKIYVLEKTSSDDGNHRYAWIDSGAELPREIAYGASVTIPGGVLCIGGRSVDRCFNDCFLLKWNAEARKVEIEPWPPLPLTLANHSAVKIENVIYVLGGRELSQGRATNTFLALDLSKRGDGAAFQWQKLAAWDGPARLNALAVAGIDGENESIYLCGGRNPGAAEDFLTDLHRYDPRRNSWAMLGNAVDSSGEAATLMAAPSFFVPPHHLVIVGGSDQRLIELLEEQGRRAATADSQEAQDRKKLLAVLLENYPGYSRNVMAFDIVASEWLPLGAFPDKPPVATPVVYWDGGMILPGGETGPGRRTNKIWMATVRKKARIVE